MFMKNFLLIILIINLFSCKEKNVSNPIDAYKYWSGEKPPADVNVINASYWESAHFFREYRLFMELKSSKEWRKEFIKQNSLIIDSSNNYNFSAEKPFWFKVYGKFQLYILKNNIGSNSLYYIDTISNHFFIYEEQL